MGLSETELAKLKKRTLEQMCQDRQKLVVRFPFTGGFLMRLELVPVRDRRLRTAATDGERVFMSIGFCSQLSAEERLFVMAHEAWHGILLHMLRQQGREPQTFNVATDMEVNRMLLKEGVRTPPWCLMPKREWEELAAEEIYERLRKRKEPPPEMAKPGGEQAGLSGQFDKHIQPGEGTGWEDKTPGAGKESVSDEWGEVGLDPDFTPSIDRRLAEKVRERIVAVAQQIERMRGTVPSHLESLVKAALRPQIRWQEVLAQFVTSCYGGSRRWLPPSRRHVGQGLYLQSSRQERLKAVVAVDTSGSTTADLPQFFEELESLLRTFGEYEVTVIQCDCKVQDVEVFDAFHPLCAPEWRTYGHGGTDFCPPFDWLAEHPETEPACFIYVTDGYGPAPETPPPWPVLWVLTGDGHKSAEWGWEVRLERDEGQRRE